GLAGGARTGELFGAQGQDQLQRLDPDFMDNTIDYLARALDHVNDGEQDLAIGLTELLDDGDRLLGGARADLIGLTQAGWLLSDSRFRQPDSNRSRPPSTTNLQLRPGRRRLLLTPVLIILSP